MTGIYYLISGYRVKKLNGKYQNKNYKQGQSVLKNLHGQKKTKTKTCMVYHMALNT